MKEKTRDVIVGLTTVVGVVGLIYLLTIVGGLSEAFERGYQVTIQLPSASGLHADSRVIYSGIDIGRIQSVRFDQTPGSGVIAVALITEQGLVLPQDVTATVRYLSMLGGSAVADMARAPVPIPGYLPTDGSAVITGDAAVDFSQVAEELRHALGGPMAELERISDNFEAISREWTLVGQNVNRLVEMRSTGEVDDGQAVGNLTTVLARADVRLAQLRVGIEGFNRFANDEQLYDDVRTTAANARQLSQRANDSVESLRARYIAVADDLSTTVQSMQKLADQALKGEGTFGKLMNDPDLYENLNDASERLKTAIDDVRLLVEKWKAEGLPVQF